MKKRFIPTICLLSLFGCDQTPQKETTQSSEVKSVDKPVLRSISKMDVTGSSSAKRKVNVGVLDFNKVWHNAKAPVQIREAIQEKRRHYQREVINLEEKLRRQEGELQAQREGESATDYKKRRKEFEAEVLTVQKQVKESAQKLSKAYSTAMGQVSDKLNEIVKQIAVDRQLDLILSQNQVAFNNQELNITEQVMQELDAKMPSIEITS